jgi:hypothetical protein
MIEPPDFLVAESEADEAVLADWLCPTFPPELHDAIVESLLANIGIWYGEWALAVEMFGEPCPRCGATGTPVGGEPGLFLRFGCPSCDADG